MGGNIFDSRRINKEEFNEISNEIINNFPSEFKLSIIKSYSSKDTFGDIDILYDNEYTTNLIKHLTTTHIISRNGPVTSILYRCAQVDFIGVSSKEYNFAFNYFSYNDLGNLIGRIAHSLGFKFGHNGLFFIIRDKDNPNRIIQQVLITADYQQALDFIGYPSIENCDFITLDDIFNFVMENKYARPEIFLLENRNHTSRVRDRKRKTYMQFLQFIHGKSYLNRIQPNKDHELQRAFIVFPEFKETYDRVMIDYEKSKERKNKFNGNIINEVTGLEGKELGVFMKMIERELTDDIIDSSSVEQIKDQIQLLFSNSPLRGSASFHSADDF